jgi:hypothetical protein
MKGFAVVFAVVLLVPSVLTGAFGAPIKTSLLLAAGVLIVLGIANAIKQPGE